MADALEIQELKNSLKSEQEDKNELNKKLQHLEKECKDIHLLTLLLNIVSRLFMSFD